MSPASYLTAPPRVAANSVAPSTRKSSVSEPPLRCAHRAPDLALTALPRRRTGGLRDVPRAARARALADHEGRRRCVRRRARRRRAVGRGGGCARCEARPAEPAPAGGPRAARGLTGAARRPERRGRRGRSRAAGRQPLGASQVIRVAAVDLGTNSTRLLVADVEGERVDEVVRRTVITRLGEGVDRRRRLLPVPVARVRNALTDFRR